MAVNCGRSVELEYRRNWLLLSAHSSDMGLHVVNKAPQRLYITVSLGGVDQRASRRGARHAHRVHGGMGPQERLDDIM